MRIARETFQRGLSGGWSQKIQKRRLYVTDRLWAFIPDALIPSIHHKANLKDFKWVGWKGMRSKRPVRARVVSAAVFGFIFAHIHILWRNRQTASRNFTFLKS